MNALSPWHIILIAVVLLLLFGPNKLPELGRGFGKMFREFKDATNGNSAITEAKPEALEAQAPKQEQASANDAAAPSVGK
ncbi:sec-independent protein translocase protein TatA [Paenibacillus sp. UNCCL117]|uniref:twin-arginine translocase TatA/TatE family subunit n=1 Tax=unclassified Paenibacillus TaxID=185978 RepID=UPI00087F7D5D|nr:MULTISPECIES: twin-arginine translocase TatA/TatE family subunit [unclassified Paenibacillus]SDC22096.1 sec-independent protein translocase protein TatA [Paenibacillus sp. cl123]SFW18957.1 sec-independent protein translocase protein TatA [Paenibacillus sp. UNCCL117]